MVGINALAHPTRFFLTADQLHTEDGRIIVLPTETAKQQLIEHYRRDPESVFILESGPVGPIAEHSLLLGQL